MAKYTTDRLPAGHEATITGAGTVFYGNPGESKTLLGAVSSSSNFGPYPGDRIIHMFSTTNDPMGFSSVAVVVDEDTVDIDGGNIDSSTITNSAISDSTVVAPMTNYSADGAIAASNHIAIVDKETAGAYTLAAPSSDGLELTIVSDTAAAHVVTCPSEIIVDGSGTPKDTLTFAAQVGANAKLVSYDSTWVLLSVLNVTPSDEA